MPERTLDLPEGFPDLPQLKEAAFQALLHIDWCAGIARTAAEAARHLDNSEDTRYCCLGIAYILRETASQVSLLEQFLSEIPTEEAQA